MYKKSNKLIEKNILLLCCFLVIWQTIDAMLHIKEIILPNPYEIFSALVNNFQMLTKHTIITSAEALCGFLLAIIFSIALAIIFHYYYNIKSICYPYIIAIQASPILAFAPLLILWFGNGFLSKVIISSLVAFFPILVNMIKGLSSVDPSFIELFRSLQATNTQLLLKLELPHAQKYLFPALRTSSTFAIVGATIGEFSGASKGIGHVIVNASYYAETSMLFAALLMISLVGIILFYLLGSLEKRIVFWEE